MSSGAEFPSGSDPRSAPGTEDASEGGAARPAVAGSASGSTPWLVGGGAVLLGLVAFLWLSSHRPHANSDLPPPSSDTTALAAPSTPPEVDAMQAAARGQLPPQAAPAVALVTPPPAPLPVIIQPPPRPLAPPTSDGKAPVLVVDLANAPGGAAGAAAAAKAAESKGAAGGPSGLNGDEQFAARVEGGALPEHATASLLRNQSTLAPQGTIIPAVLETALNSDLPGYARAVVSRDVRSFDGTNVLIPRGSRVIGEYRSSSSLGASRIFVIWTRILRPDGGSIQISSGGGDMLGRAGLAGKVDRHFFERFSGAVLLTVLNAAAYAAAGTPSTQVTVGSSGGGGLTSGLLPTDIPPTIKVAQGSPIRIFVQRDLDFTPVGETSR